MKVIRNRDSAKKLGVSMPTYWRMAKRDPTFPQAVAIVGKITGRIEEELDAWIAQRVAASREPKASAK